jgi:hypothetical protein
MHTRMDTIKKYSSLFIACTILLLAGCKKWDDHNEADASLQVNLIEEINSRPDLSRFSELLAQTGLDQELSATKMYTVWAPTNDALQQLDPAIVNDDNKLKAFLKNHMASQSYYTHTAKQVVRVLMLSGKRIPFGAGQFDAATITEADRYVKNGVLHVVDKPVPPLPSIWEFLNSTTATYQQNKFIAGYNYKVRDLTNAIIDSINAQTGEPVYRPGTDSVTRNRYNDAVYDLKNEDSLYTYILLDDALFGAEVIKLSKFFKTGTADSTYNLSAIWMSKDLTTVISAYPSTTPDMLVQQSRFNVKDTIYKNAITATHKCSNGIVYVVKSIAYAMKEKFPSIILQGEFPRDFMADRRSNTYYRLRTDPSGKQFNDIVMFNHGLANYYVNYRVLSTPSNKYKVYWVAVNDFQATTFQQKLSVGSITAPSFGYVTVPLNNYQEVYLGEFTAANFGVLDLYLTGANSTANGVNSLTLDYIRLEPQNL